MVDCWKKNWRLNLVRLYFNIFPVTFWNSLLTFFLSVIYFITFPPDFLPQSRHCMCRGQGAGCRWLSRWRLNITNIPSSLEAGQPDTPPNRETAFTINRDPVWWLWKGISQVSPPSPPAPPPQQPLPHPLNNPCPSPHTTPATISSYPLKKGGGARVVYCSHVIHVLYCCHVTSGIINCLNTHHRKSIILG